MTNAEIKALEKESIRYINGDPNARDANIPGLYMRLHKDDGITIEVRPDQYLTIDWIIDEDRNFRSSVLNAQVLFIAISKYLADSNAGYSARQSSHERLKAGVDKVIEKEKSAKG